MLIRSITGRLSGLRMGRSARLRNTSLDALVDLFAMNFDGCRRGDSDTHLLASCGKDHDADVVVDADDFANSVGENQHVLLLFSGRANPGRDVGFRKIQVGLNGLSGLDAADGHASFDAALTWATDAIHVIVGDGGMAGEDCADQHHQVARDAAAEQFSRNCRTTGYAELVENALNGFFDGARSATDGAGDFLVSKPGANGKGGAQLLLCKNAGCSLQLAEIDNRAHLFFPPCALLMDKNISRLIEVIKQYFDYFLPVHCFSLINRRKKARRTGLC